MAKWGVWAVRHEGILFGYAGAWHKRKGKREEFDTEPEARERARKLNDMTGSALVSYRAELLDKMEE